MNETDQVFSNSNVVWGTPSKNSAGSMPIGNGDIGANVWIEENGDLLLLVSNGGYVKYSGGTRVAGTG